MTPITLAAWFSSAAVVLSAITAYFVARRGSAEHLSRRFTQLQERFELMADVVATQEVSIMQLRSRVTMQATRDKRKNPPPSSEISLPDSGEDSKADARRKLGAQLANGTIKPIGR